MKHKLDSSLELSHRDGSYEWYNGDMVQMTGRNICFLVRNKKEYLNADFMSLPHLIWFSDAEF